MPAISIFFGIIIQLLFYDNKEHKSPHIHARYSEFLGSFDIQTGDILSGSMPPKQVRLIQAWIEIHRDELLANWQRAVEGKEIFKIQRTLF